MAVEVDLKQIKNRLRIFLNHNRFLVNPRYTYLQMQGVGAAMALVVALLGVEVEPLLAAASYDPYPASSAVLEHQQTVDVAGPHATMDSVRPTIVQPLNRAVHLSNPF